MNFLKIIDRIEKKHYHNIKAVYNDATTMISIAIHDGVFSFFQSLPLTESSFSLLLRRILLAHIPLG